MRLSELHRALAKGSPGLSSIKVMHILDVHDRHFRPLERITRRRKERQSLIAQLRELAEPCGERYVYGHEGYDGLVVAVVVWSRDCDMAEGTNRYFVPAYSQPFDEFLDRLYANAEGPTTWRLQRPSDEFESSFRDRALEAFEDGHQHTIYT